MPEQSQPLALPTVGKVEWVVTDCLYRVATGVWPPGARLPSLRRAAQLWAVNELTCLRAYRRLIAQGIIRSRQRGGYFVAEGASVARLRRHQDDLQGLYQVLANAVRRRTDLSVLGAARAIARMAEAHAAEKPECAFVECTQFQAQGHADEVESRLRVPCAALTVAQMGGKWQRIPGHIRTVLTTYFHFKELAALSKASGWKVTPVPIEPGERLLRELRESSPASITVLTLGRAMAKSIATDLHSRVRHKGISFRSRQASTEAIEGLLRELLGADSPGRGRMVLLSPTLWSAVDQHWKDRRDVRPITYEVVPSAWPEIADAVGMLPSPTLAPPTETAAESPSRRAAPAEHIAE
jgi:DNA-binding transcriptional regulator YhcF (GntR family)